MRLPGACSVLFACACGASPQQGALDASAPGRDARGLAADAGASPAARDAAPRDAASPAPDAALDPGALLVFGANVTASGVTFRLWAPNATAAAIEGDLPGGRAALTAEGEGVFSAVVPGVGAGARYRYVLDTPGGSLQRLDPYCRQLAPDGTACVVIDPSAFAWRDRAFSRAPRERSVVYELHVGSFAAPAGAAGTLAAATARLAELADLGVNVVEVMPVHAFGGRPNGWGYNPQLFLAPKPAYGTADELRGFVDEAHARGLAVWLDLVVNHTDGWTKAPLYCFDGACAEGSAGLYFFPPGDHARTPWGPRPNYPSARVTEMLLASVGQWLIEFHGDGFRWDSTSNIRGIDGQGTTPGGKELIVRGNALAHAAGALSVAEDLKGWDALTRPASDGGFGFDAQWDGFGYDVMNVLAPASDDGRDLGTVERVLRGTYAGDAFARLLFVENHDAVGNGGARLPSRIDAANPTSLAARRRSMLGGVLLLTAPGVPMLFQGQEALATGTFTNPPAVLGAPTPAGLRMRDFYKDAIALRRNTAGGTAALSEPGVAVLHRHDANKVIAYRRSGPSGEDVLVVVNLRNKAYTRYDVGAPAAGPWRVRLDTDWSRYGDDLGGGQTGPITAAAQQKDGQPFSLPVRLAPYGAVVLSR